MKPDGERRLVYRFSGARYAPRNLRRVTKFKGGGIMVWGCILRTGERGLVRVTKSITGRVYRSVLRCVVCKFPMLRAAPYLDDKIVFQQDNASCHTSKIVERYMLRNRFLVLPWPPLSPDLNPIESVWAIMARALRGRCFANAEELWRAVRKEWNAVSVTQLVGLYDSIPRRLAAVREARGDATRY